MREISLQRQHIPDPTSMTTAYSRAFSRRCASAAALRVLRIVPSCVSFSHFHAATRYVFFPFPRIYQIRIHPIYVIDYFL